MRTGKRGIDLIKSFEGCRLAAYLCPAKVWTIGYGHTAGVKEGMTITGEQAEAYLAEDLQKYEKEVVSMELKLNQNQFDALVSFTYNCGKGSLKTLVRNRTTSQIGEALLLYNKGGGKVLPGLVRRRKAEQELFLSNTEETKEEDEGGTEEMEVRVYSKAHQGSQKLSANFTVKEFACKDGSDPVLISPKLVEVLQNIREHFGQPVTINSGFRTAAHNKKEGGATYSKHQYGIAADIVVKGIRPKEVAAYAETLLPNSGGIGIYSTFTHVDVREVKARWNG